MWEIFDQTNLVRVSRRAREMKMFTLDTMVLHIKPVNKNDKSFDFLGGNRKPPWEP